MQVLVVSSGSGSVFVASAALLRLPPANLSITKSRLQFLSRPTKKPFLWLSFSISRSRASSKLITLANASVPVSLNDEQIQEADKAKLAQVSKRLESTSRYFNRLGSLGFWGQLVCTVVAAVILSFSAVATGKITSPFTFYANAGGIVAAFVSVFWSFGYIRLSDRLRRTASDPAKAPPRAEVVKSLKNGIGLNLLGMGAAILGMQATVGLLVGKALTSSAVPYYQGISSGYSPVLALDVFLVQMHGHATGPLSHQETQSNKLEAPITSVKTLSPLLFASRWGLRTKWPLCGFS